MPPKNRSEKSPAEIRQIQLSKKMSKVLRHDAEKLNVPIDAAGFVPLDHLLRLSMFRGARYTLAEIHAMVDDNAKKRFTLKEVDGKLFIRANQGHTMKCVDEAQLLTPITDASNYPLVLHGTFKKPWPSIREQGLRCVALA